MIGLVERALKQWGVMKRYIDESLSHDPIHGYIPFSSGRVATDEITERDVIDHPWLQRLRQIHQLQTAWWVFPTAEHTRFQHVIGAMHLASRAVQSLYQSLDENFADVPSRGYVESLLRMAALLHDVGHGPFGHFFDAHFLADFDLTHETLGAAIIQGDLGDLIRGIRRNPFSELRASEQLDPAEIAWLITRPREDDTRDFPPWLAGLRSLLCGIYTVDNMDFVLRDAYMSGYSSRAFDLDRLLHYSFFSPQGLTIHDRGLGGLLRFMHVRAELFSTVYFHRTVRAIDLTLADLFADSKTYLFPGNPMECLDRYQSFTEWSLLVDVRGWVTSDDQTKRSLGRRWGQILERSTPWKMVCQRSLVFSAGDAEKSSIFSEPELVEAALRKVLPGELAKIPLRIDIARHIYRPHTGGPSKGQNFFFDSSQERVRPLTDSQLFQKLPVSHRICRVYSNRVTQSRQISSAMDNLLGPGGIDDLTNM